MNAKPVWLDLWKWLEELSTKLLHLNIPSFTYRHAVLNQYGHLTTVEHTRRYLVQCSCCSFPYWETKQIPNIQNYGKSISANKITFIN